MTTYRTSSVTVAAFMLERNMKLVGHEPQRSIVWFTFDPGELCKALELEYTFGQPTVNLKTYLSCLNECRDILRIHHGPGPLSGRRQGGG